MWENFDDVVYACIVSFLTTREYVLTLSISKTIQEKSLKHKKLRMPVIGVYTWYDKKERYYKFASYDFLEKYDELMDMTNFHLNQNVIDRVLKSGKNCMRYQKDIQFNAVPYRFRHAVQTSKLCISIKKYVMFKLAKYEEKQNLNFEKLIRKRNALEIYLGTNDVYFKEFNKYLSRRLYEVNNQ